MNSESLNAQKATLLQGLECLTGKNFINLNNQDELAKESI